MSTTRRSMSSAERPGYDQTTMTTGMSIVGKMSACIRVVHSAPSSRITNEKTATV